MKKTGIISLKDMCSANEPRKHACFNTDLGKIRRVSELSSRYLKGNSISSSKQHLFSMRKKRQATGNEHDYTSYLTGHGPTKTYGKTAPLLKTINAVSAGMFRLKSLKGSNATEISLEFPMSATQALNHFKSKLSKHERKEILHYPEVFYLGRLEKKQALSKNSQQALDDSEGNYILYRRDHIAFRYEIEEVLGSGTFGVVCRCLDHKRQEKVAVKLIKNSKEFSEQASLEVKTLSQLKSGKFIVQMKNYFLFREHVCIVFELMDISLYEALRQRDFTGYPLEILQRIGSQILQGLDYIRKSGVIHCDLKPENILLNNPQQFSLKLIDFGSSCVVSDGLFSYIQSRFYRAPEVMMQGPYDSGIDMWSYGCILAELCSGEPLFPGETEAEQLSLVISLLGMPPRSIKAQSYFTYDSKLTKNREGVIKSIGKSIHCEDVSLLDLISKCLEWEYTKRIAPCEALKHSFFSK